MVYPHSLIRAALWAILCSVPVAAQVSPRSLVAPGSVSAAASPGHDWRKFKIQLLRKPFRAVYSRRGLELASREGGYTARIQWRVQPLFATPYRDDPRKPAGFAPVEDHIVMRRARFKMEGQAFGGFVTYKYEHDLVGRQLLDLYADVNFKPWLRVRFGQWKSVFTQERYISSGRQQFVDRSILNREFNLDRQAGFSVFGRLAKGTRGDSAYNLEILNGIGQNNGLSWDSSPLVVARYQWNFLKSDPGFSSSDIERHASPSAFIAFTAARNTSAFTRYSGQGAGQLDGFEPGGPNRYRLMQANAEFMLKYRGLSIQNENHWKRVHDNAGPVRRTLTGSYIQAGYFPHGVWKRVSPMLEVMYRYAVVDPNRSLGGDLRQEHSMGLNLFLEGHDHKWTFDVTRHSLQQPGGAGVAGFRYRLQYDVQF
jgi:phosphate-selective porin OprO/OprP